MQFLHLVCQISDAKTALRALRRGWGGVRKACADEFYPIVEHFWLVWRILCTLLHFDKNTVIILGYACKRVVAVILAPTGLGITYPWLYFDSQQFM